MGNVFTLSISSDVIIPLCLAFIVHVYVTFHAFLSSKPLSLHLQVVLPYIYGALLVYPGVALVNLPRPPAYDPAFQGVIVQGIAGGILVIFSFFFFVVGLSNTAAAAARLSVKA
eukprot:TRINITY_DN24305_c0_g1_i1.p1 TRINITY_DN24305_c0_g1~~TRINITY_DN24305_c0_g1_i1.p1  ORF type:complete len:114 (+),score=6.89 TRINITY_DN24305_c0_g1_i1:157-498(+)